MPRPIPNDIQYRDSILLALLALDEIPRDPREDKAARAGMSGTRYRHALPRG